MHSVSEMENDAVGRLGVRSFDIFDTVLTRRLSCPVDVFIMVGERLSRAGFFLPPPTVFRKLRIRCERWSRRLQPSYEVTLTDIYDLLGGLLLWTDQQKLVAADTERKVEAEVLTATSHGLAAVHEARDRGAKIAFVSDMYLESSFLRTILIREGLFREGDLIAVSGEWKASKAAGIIWPILLHRLGVEPGALFHQGDHPHSDVASPGKHGIHAQRLGTAEVSRWEQWCPRGSGLPVDTWGEIATMSRLARVRAQNPDHYWTQLGTGVLGPMIVGFVSWLINTAVRDGIGTLWFLSRDGWMFYEAARHLAKDCAIKIQYIAVSRNQLRFARDGGCPISELWSGSRHLSARLVRERLNFCDADMEELLRACGLAAAAADIPLDSVARESLGKTLETEPWKQRRAERALEAAAALKSYIEECASAASGSVAVVDIGWKGRSQDDLMRLCPSVAMGYYLGLSHGAVECHKKSWLYDARRAAGDIRLDRYQRMIEMLVGGISGPLQGYQSHEDGWRPLFATQEDGELAPGREVMQGSARAFVTDSSLSFTAASDQDQSMLYYVTVNFLRLLVFPTSQDARYFATWKSSTDDAHQDLVYPARGYDLRRIVSCVRSREPWSLLWLEASIRNSSFLGGLFIKWARWLKNWIE